MRLNTPPPPVILVPELVRKPVLGSRCCTVTGAWLIEDALTELPGVQDVHVEDENGRVEVVFDPDTTSLEQITTALKALGFPPAMA